MARLIKGFLIGLGLAILCVTLYVGYVYRNLKLQSEVAEHVRAEKQPAFQARLTQYQNALQIGATRAEVLKYLQAQNVGYTEDQKDIQVFIGEEPDFFTCDSWNVYVFFDFYKAQPRAEPSSIDRLASISLQKIGHCL